jgi:Na+/H+-dicarboxylate symporter
MCATVANVTGDTVTAVMVARSERQLDVDVYNR